MTNDSNFFAHFFLCAIIKSLLITLFKIIYCWIDKRIINHSKATKNLNFYFDLF
jgi:hypothetical protein